MLVTYGQRSKHFIFQLFLLVNYSISFCFICCSKAILSRYVFAYMSMCCIAPRGLAEGMKQTTQF